MPVRAAKRVIRRSASAPSRWPRRRRSPRLLAQRPLPSMMKAIWRGFRRSGIVGRAALPRGTRPPLPWLDGLPQTDDRVALLSHRHHGDGALREVGDELEVLPRAPGEVLEAAAAARRL